MEDIESEKITIPIFVNGKYTDEVRECVIFSLGVSTARVDQVIRTVMKFSHISGSFAISHNC